MAPGTVIELPARAEEFFAGLDPAFDRRQQLAAANPLLALAYWIEAAADRRIECDVNALSLLTDIRDRAREAVARQQGAPFRNPMYPERRR